MSNTAFLDTLPEHSILLLPVSLRFPSPLIKFLPKAYSKESESVSSFVSHS